MSERNSFSSYSRIAILKQTATQPGQKYMDYGREQNIDLNKIRSIPPAFTPATPPPAPPIPPPPVIDPNYVVSGYVLYGYVL